VDISRFIGNWRVPVALGNSWSFLQFLIFGLLQSSKIVKCGMIVVTLVQVSFYTCFYVFQILLYLLVFKEHLSIGNLFWYNAIGFPPLRLSLP